MSIVSFIEDDILKPLVHDLAGEGDTIFQALKKAAAAGIEGAGEALGLYTPPGAQPGGAFANLAASLNAAVDAAIVSAVDHIPVIGEIIAPELVAEANKVLTSLETGAHTLASNLISEALKKLGTLGTAQAS